MTYILAFMMCIGSECRYMNFELPDLRSCQAMKRLVIQEAHDEGFAVSTICAPVAIEVKQ